MRKTMLAFVLSAIAASGAVRGRLLINGLPGGRFQPGQAWTLSLENAKPDSEFAICGTYNDGGSVCASAFGKTDSNGSWKHTGTFDNAVAGMWSEWVVFPSGATSTLVSFDVGASPFSRDLRINNGIAGVFPVGQPWVLAVSNAPAASSFSICGSHNGEEAVCTPKFAGTDAAGTWSAAGTFFPSTAGHWTEWIEFAIGKKTNPISFTVDTEIASSVYGVAFSPYMEGQDPAQEIQIGDDQIRQRLAIIAPYTEWIRTYGATHGSENIARIAREFGLKVAAGMWLSNNGASNLLEMENLISMLESGDVDIGVIGSEVLTRGDLTEREVLDFIAQVRKAVPGAVLACAESWPVLMNHPNLVNAVDVVFAHYYPFWEGRDIDSALGSLEANDAALRRQYPKKEIIVGETGWPSSGQSQGSAVPTVQNSARYFQDFVSWARGMNRKFFYFSAFDEAWKIRDEGPVGAWWGIWYQSGLMKPGMEQVFNTEIAGGGQQGSDRVAPSAPKALTARAASSSAIDLEWPASTDNVGVTGYRIYRNSQQISVVSATTYRDTGLAATTTYSYAVSAFDAAGNSSPLSPIAQATTGPVQATDLEAPTVPSGVTAVLVSSTQAEISWTASTDNVGVTGYSIHRNGYLLARTSATVYYDAAIVPGTQYFYTVSAYDAAGNNSSPSAAVPLATLCPAPGGPGAPSIAFTYIPPKGTFIVDDLKGTVSHVPPAEYYVAVFIRVRGGWWTKPYWSDPQTKINCDGTWSCDITTGGVDEEADQINAYLFPNSFAVPLLQGETALPPALDASAAAKILATR